jgi:branched-subunit amino acid aminotransferase/4-amino-4-deoxychorismate lyase
MTRARREPALAGRPTSPWPAPDDPRFPGRPVWINGHLRRGSEASVSVFDRGARDGLALFETIRVEGRVPLDWHAHMERLVLAAAELAFPVPPSPDLLREGLTDLLAASVLDDAAVRLTISQGIPGIRPGRPGCWIDAEPLEGRLWRGARTGRAAAIVSRIAHVPGPFARYKTAHRLVHQRAGDEARAAGADEAILASAEGEVFEGAVSNVFCVRGGAACTPPVARGIIPGTVRAAVIREARAAGVPLREAPLTRDDLAAADEVFVTNALQLVVPLHALDGRELPSRAIGERLREACRAGLRRDSGAPPGG